MTVRELDTLISDRPSRHLRLPIVVKADLVYTDVTVEDLRAFLPRSLKEIYFPWELED